MFFVERFNGRGWHVEGAPFPNRGEALRAIEGFRMLYGSKTLFRIIVK